MIAFLHSLIGRRILASPPPLQSQEVPGLNTPVSIPSGDGDITRGLRVWESRLLQPDHPMNMHLLIDVGVNTDLRYSQYINQLPIGTVRGQPMPVGIS